MNDLHITSSLKLLEYMELIELPMQYPVTRISMESYSIYIPGGPFYEVTHSDYKNYVITDGLVRSYEYSDPYGYRIVNYYNGWECGTSMSAIKPNAFQNGISNLKQFQELYPSR